MGRTVEIKLNDAQYAALSAQVEASGQRFYDYCRNKLMADLSPYGRSPVMEALPRIKANNDWAARFNADNDATLEKLCDGDRIARVEKTLAKLVDHILAQPGVVRTIDAGAEGHHVPMTLIDVDSMVESTLADAEQQGLTEPRYSEADHEFAVTGVRSVGPRRAPPYSPGTQPSHLRSM